MRYGLAALLLLAACEKAPSSEARQISEKIGKGVMDMKWDDVTPHFPNGEHMGRLNGLRMLIDDETKGNAKHIEFVDYSETKSGDNTMVKIDQRILMRGGFHNSEGVTARLKYQMTMAKQGDKWTVSALTVDYVKEPK